MRSRSLWWTMAMALAYTVELLLRFSYEEEGANPSIFKLLVETLDRLEKETDAWLPVRYYEMRLLDALGFVRKCSSVQIVGARWVLPEDQYFSYTAGGVICPRCGEGLNNLSRISLETLKYLRHFQRSSYRDASRARPSPEVQKEAET